MYDKKRRWSERSSILGGGKRELSAEIAMTEKTPGKIMRKYNTVIPCDIVYSEWNRRPCGDRAGGKKKKERLKEGRK